MANITCPCRRATHAGSWYSSSGEALGEQMRGWLSAAGSSCVPVTRPPRAVISPHAGFSYSGKTAAYAFHHLNPSPQLKRVFILGPSHAWYLPTCALPVAGSYETPLYNLEVDVDVVEALRATGKFETFELRRDEREHSIEMMMPFVAHKLQGHAVKIVPILVGSTSVDNERVFGEMLAPYIDSPENFFVISSDFCHWGSRFDYRPTAAGEAAHETITRLDHEGMDLIERLDTDAFASYLGRTHNTICGRHPIAVLMHALRASASDWDLKFIKYDQSSKAVSRNDSSVSYASAVVSPSQ